MYMSPEQCAGAGGVDAKTDVYSFGCVLYQALAGRPPFIADGSGQFIGMHLYQTPPLLASLAPKLPSAVVTLVHRLLTKDKLQRPSMADVADELASLLSQIPGAGPVSQSRQADHPDIDDKPQQFPVPSTLGHSTGQKKRNTTYLPLLVGAGASLVIVASVLLILRLSTPGRTERPAVPHPSPVSTPSISSPLRTVPAAPTSAPTPSPAPRVVLWQLATQPPGATVLDEKNLALGTTPWSAMHPATPGKVAFRLRREGYSEATILLDGAADTAQTINLLRLPMQPKNNQLPKLRGNSLPASQSVPPKPGRIGYED